MKLEETIRILYDAALSSWSSAGPRMGFQDPPPPPQNTTFFYPPPAKNMERLAKALEPFHPVLRGAPPDLPFRFDVKTIGNGLNFTLSTDLGDLGFLGEVSGLGSFQEVLAASDVRYVGGVDCRVLSLEGLIKSKTAAGRPRVLYVLRELRALSELKRKTGLD